MTEKSYPSLRTSGTLRPVSSKTLGPLLERSRMRLGFSRQHSEFSVRLLARYAAILPSHVPLELVLRELGVSESFEVLQLLISLRRDSTVATPSAPAATPAAAVAPESIGQDGRVTLERLIERRHRIEATTFIFSPLGDSTARAAGEWSAAPASTHPAPYSLPAPGPVREQLSSAAPVATPMTLLAKPRPAAGNTRLEAKGESPVASRQGTMKLPVAETTAPLKLAPQEIARVTERVLKSIDARIVATRERRGVV